MSGLIMTVQLLLGLSILVVLHELGHFIAARVFGMRVEKFYLFFNPWGIKLFGVKRGDTEYGIGWLPLGGYVKIAGMMDESMDKEELKKPPQPWEFRSKPAWQRLIVMLGGVTVNLVLGIFIFGMTTYYYGDKYLPMDQLRYGIVALELGEDIGLKTGDKIISVNNKKVKRFSDVFNPKNFIDDDMSIQVNRDGNIINIPIPDDFLQKLSSSKDKNFVELRMTFFVKQVIPNSNADKAGLMVDDKIIAINNQSIRFFDECRDMLGEHKGEQISISVKRGDNQMELSASVDDNGKLGFYHESDDFEYAVDYYGLPQSFVIGGSEAIDWLVLNIKGFGKIFSGEISASDSIAGPIGIATIYGGEWIWQKFWFITGILSMILAFVNVLPIPALDGGHAFFLSIEAVSGKKFSDTFMERVQIAGMIILMALMSFIIGNDIWKYILN